MPLYFNGNTIGDLYFGGTKIGEAWFNGQQVYTSALPVINYMFRDIDVNGNLTLATGTLEDASEITSIGNYGLYYAFYKCTGLTGNVSFPNLTSIGSNGLCQAFYGCTGLTGISFPNLTSIGSNGLRYAFYDCAGLTGNISFPNLTSIGSGGLQYAFDNCTGLIGGSVFFPSLTSIESGGLKNSFRYGYPGVSEVHFKSSLSGNSECTASNIGNPYATVYFDL